MKGKPLLKIVMFLSFISLIILPSADLRQMRTENDKATQEGRASRAGDLRRGATPRAPNVRWEDSGTEPSSLAAGSGLGAYDGYSAASQGIKMS